MTKNKLLVSGASGFIGSRLMKRLKADNVPVIGIGRKNLINSNYVACDLHDNIKLEGLLQDVDGVIHCAGYAHSFGMPQHIMADTHWKINYLGTKNLLELAARCGVRSFVNLSSVKVMSNTADICIDESWPAVPVSPYGKSKLAAENLILEVGKRYGMHIVNLRLAMVYGFGGSGNLERMSKLIHKGLFPPIPETHNHRSLIHVDDVLEAILLASRIPKLNGLSLIVSGSEAPSGRGIYDEIRRVYGMKATRIEVPLPIMKILASSCEFIQKSSGVNLIFNQEVCDRLLKSEWYSSGNFEKLTGWRANIKLQDGLREMLNVKAEHQESL